MNIEAEEEVDIGKIGPRFGQEKRPPTAAAKSDVYGFIVSAIVATLLYALAVAVCRDRYPGFTI